MERCAEPERGAWHRVGAEADPKLKLAEHLAFQRLTPRQQQIALLIGEGKSEADIGRLLSLAKATVTFHKQHIMGALGIASDEELLRYAVLIRACLRRATTSVPERARPLTRGVPA